MKKITEESGIQKEWRAEIETMTMEKLPEFLRKLTQDYEHDYGTICHAFACGAIATAKAMDRCPQGGISGFQAGAVMWEMIDLWRVFDEGPKRMVCFNDLLYPQMEEKFRTISAETWSFIQEKATNNLKENDFASPRVIEHWRSIVAGIVPFGLEVAGAH